VNTTLSSQDASTLRDFSSSLFAVDLAGILFILAAFAHVINMEEKKLVEPALATLFRNERNRMLIIAVIMLVSVAPLFWQVTVWGDPARLYVWYLPLVSYWLGRIVRPESRTYIKS